jgi:hypothetical protein
LARRFVAAGETGWKRARFRKAPPQPASAAKAAFGRLARAPTRACDEIREGYRKTCSSRTISAVIASKAKQARLGVCGGGSVWIASLSLAMTTEADSI